VQPNYRCGCSLLAAVRVRGNGMHNNASCSVGSKEDLIDYSEPDQPAAQLSLICPSHVPAIFSMARLPKHSWTHVLQSLARVEREAANQNRTENQTDDELTSKVNHYIIGLGTVGQHGPMPNSALRASSYAGLVVPEAASTSRAEVIA
jgi:hypothetical protein